MTPYFAACIAILALVTMSLRSAPFALPRAWLQSETVRLLSRWLPSAIMATLVVHSAVPYCDGSRRTPAALLGLTLVIALHLWRRHFLLSIFSGTAFYMIAQRCL